MRARLAGEVGLPKRAGRAPSPKSYSAWLKREFDLVLPVCELIHETAKTTTKNSTAMARRAIYEAIYEKSWHLVTQVPHFGAIFSEEAFEEIPFRGTKKPQLSDAASWSARQLAIALLAVRIDGAYQTVEKTLPRISHRN
jgi:hypothetical protein